MEYEEKAWAIYRFDDFNNNVKTGNDFSIKLFYPPIQVPSIFERDKND